MAREIETKKESVCISVNPKIYPLDVIYSAAYVFLDKSYILLGGDPKKEIKIELRIKDSSNIKNLKKLKGEFLNELINYSFYKKQAKKTANIRKIILQRALLTNIPEKISEEKEEEKYELEDIPDPEGIAIPWDQKYNKKGKKNKKK